MKTDEMKMNQDSTKIPVEIVKQIPLFTEDNIVGAMINEEIFFNDKEMIRCFDRSIDDFQKSSGMKEILQKLLINQSLIRIII